MIDAVVITDIVVSTQSHKSFASSKARLKFLTEITQEESQFPGEKERSGPACNLQPSSGLIAR